MPSLLCPKCSNDYFEIMGHIVVRVSVEDEDVVEIDWNSIRFCDPESDEVEPEITIICPRCRHKYITNASQILPAHHIIGDLVDDEEEDEEEDDCDLPEWLIDLPHEDPE